MLKTGIYHRANYIVPNNHSQGRYLAKMMPSIKDKIRVITNYTDIKTYISSPVPNNDVVKVGIFCRFEQQKNFLRFIETVKILVTEGYKFHIDWYGNHNFKNPSQKEYFEKGVYKIREYKLDDYITIYGPTREVSSLIPSFDVLCLPSLHEGFSNSISEYILYH